MLHPQARRGGFTLVELLLATTIMTMIITMMGVIFTNTERIVARTRAIIDISYRLRAAMDQSEEAMVNRSGCMPMQAGNMAWTSNQRFNLFSYQANNHLDYGKTPVESGLTIANPNGAELPPTISRCWSCDVDEDGNLMVAGAPIDPHAPGKQIKEFTAGDATWLWGVGSIGIIHSTTMEEDTNLTYYNAGTPTLRSRTFPDFNSAGNNSASSFGTSATRGIGRRYTRLSTTSGDIGPYRRVSILPTVHFHNGFKVWSDTEIRKSFLMRSIRGPSFPGEIWGTNTVWTPTTTGDYGKENPDAGWHSYYEPDWTTVMSGGSVATAAAANDVPWRYGSLIRDESVTWRCEAPPLFVKRTDGTGWAQRQVPIRRDRPWWWNGTAFAESWRFLSAYFYDYRGPTDFNFHPISYTDAQHVHSMGTDTMDWPSGSMPNDGLDPILAEANISRFSVRNGRVSSTWYPAAPSGTLGRFGSLSRRSWHLGRSGDNPDRGNGSLLPSGLVAGFHGSLPTGLSSPGHPPWVEVQIGAVGGFDSRAGGSAVETTATVVMVLR
jgi:hypothetical protein